MRLHLANARWLRELWRAPQRILRVAHSIGIVNAPASVPLRLRRRQAKRITASSTSQEPSSSTQSATIHSITTYRLRTRSAGSGHQVFFGRDPRLSISGLLERVPLSRTKIGASIGGGLPLMGRCQEKSSILDTAAPHYGGSVRAKSARRSIRVGPAIRSVSADSRNRITPALSGPDPG